MRQPSARGSARPPSPDVYSPPGHFCGPTHEYVYDSAVWSRQELPGHLELTPAWQDIRSRLRTSVGDSTYDIWLAPLEIKSWDGSVLLLQGKPGTDSWIADRYGRELERCARAVFGSPVKVAFAGDPAAVAHDALSKAGPAGPAGLVGPNHERFNPRHTFDQFVIGDGNRLAHAAVLAVAEAPGQAYNPLFLYAPPGLGKTHLLNAIANYIRRYDRSTTVRYTTVEAFTNGFIAALRGEALDRFKRLYRDVDVLLIDDVQFLASKAKTEEEFFHTFNALYDSGRQLVLTCDRLPSQLTGIEQRLRERFESGLVAHLTAPDWATRITILRKRALVDNVKIDDSEVFEAIAERVTDNVRSLEGALIRIVAHHSLTGQPIDRRLATTVLDSIHPIAVRSGSPNGNSSSPTIPAIQQLVAQHFSLAVTDLTGASRIGQVSWARQLAIYLVRELTDTPLQRIGDAFGGRNHATVLHACKRVSDRISVNNDDAADLQELSSAIGHQQ
ncbi:MAG TPA: chromosomal replication initiator protein DnaA [Solirubrobacteraceae bacterium]|nr:chromosomal replication initiator protein DnaA [Solirubrobacteraceae bacterium]